MQNIYGICHFSGLLLLVWRWKDIAIQPVKSAAPAVIPKAHVGRADQTWSD